MSLTLIFFVTFALLSALFIATYAGRSAWVACCSSAMSIAALLGTVFVSSFDDAKEVRVGLMLLARQLPLLLDQRTLDELTIAIDQSSSLANCGRERKSCIVASRVESLILQDDDPRRTGSPSEAPPAKQATFATNSRETKKDSEEIARWPVSWIPDDSILPVSENPAPGFWIRGINISDQPLREVQAILKPDANHHELNLTVNVQGNQFEDKAVLPAGARFTLGAGIPKLKKPFGGAILTFRYNYAGGQRAEIFYLTAAMIAR